MPFDPHLPSEPTGAQHLAIRAAIARAAAAIPPAWPLAATVAVNPFLGQAEETLAVAAARLRRVAGERAAMPLSWYAARVAAGEITESDLAEALASSREPNRPADTNALRALLAGPDPEPVALPTIADLAAEATGTDWPGIVADRLGAFAAGWFDEGQALWPAPHRGSLFRSWRATALRDLTPEILGLGGFCSHVAAAPAEPEVAAARALAALGVPEAARATYLHRLLMTLGGWAQLARKLGFEAELAGGTDATVGDLLAARLVWEEALFARHGEAIAAAWRDVLVAHAAPVAPTEAETAAAILQEAAERAAQRQIAAALAARPSAPEGRPALQAFFCIDVRSEVFRRALEQLDPGIRTGGFAGFFGLPLAHRAFASDVVENRLPVLLRPSVFTCTAVTDNSPKAKEARIAARARRAWGRFSQAAVSSFAFVESAGLLHGVNLLADSFGLGRKGKAEEPPPRAAAALAPDQKIAVAETVLRAMSLTAGFAPLVLLAGHGARVVNNPHASALACGACGGYQGDVSARLLAALLNDAEVRSGLAGRGIAIPEDTLFVAALHDTTTDAVTLYDADTKRTGHEAALAQARRWLAQAGALARAERALRLPRAGSAEAVLRRSRDWSETRPEWGLAGCRAFIAAPRAATAGRDLGGRAFLHDYDWREDRGFGVLELILTAPVVVASWISLQYYGSVTAPLSFGGGNKLLHNVTGGIGVVEGNGGLLRTGLPWQSVHDGERLQHDPLRLTVCITAPRSAIEEILARHPGVRALFDNRWLHLLVTEADGALWRYRGPGDWSIERAAPEPVEAVTAAVS